MATHEEPTETFDSVMRRAAEAARKNGGISCVSISMGTGKTEIDGEAAADNIFED